MKAYILGIRDDPDQGNQIVFAGNATGAKKQLDGNQFMYESWIDIECLRAKSWDGKENLTPKELMKEQWREGWWFHQTDYPDPDEGTDEQFYEWYDKTYGDENA